MVVTLAKAKGVSGSAPGRPDKRAPETTAPAPITSQAGEGPPDG
jgi:hypothetical protein